MGLVLFTLPLLGAVTLGESIAVLGTIASFLLNHPHQQQPTFKAMTSCWGAPWPIIYNSFRVAAKVIQAGPVNENAAKKSKKGGPTFSQTLCMGFCEGERDIARIWADGTVIYDPRPITPPPAWQANTDYGAGDIILPTAGGDWQFTATVNGTSGVTEPAWNSSQDASTADGTQVWIAGPYVARTFTGKSYDFNLRIYTGSETQLPDSALEELVGVGNQSAYRGLTYIVLEDFDLSKYGGRIPNIEAEIASMPTYSTVALFGEAWVDASGGFVYLAGEDGTNNLLNKVNLSTDATAASVTISPKFQSWFEMRGSFSGSFLAWSVWDGADTFILKINATTLATIATYPWTASGFAGDDVTFYAPLFATSGDGTLCAGLFFDGVHDQYLMIMDMTSGAYSWTKVSTISGAPATTADNMLSAIVFDAAGYLWAGDDHSKLWRTTIVTHAPTAMTSFTPRSDDGRVANSLSYVPSSDDLILWLDDGLGVFTNVGKFLRWGATTHAPTTAEFSWYYETTPHPVASLDTIGWSNRGLAAIRGANGWSVDITDTLTGAATNYPLSYWGLSTGDSHLNRVAMGPTSSSIFAQMVLFDEDMATIFQLSSHMTLADICADVSERIGLSGKYDFSALASVIPRGAAVLDRMKAREFLESIMPAYFYDLTDIGPQVIGSLRAGQVSIATIPENDLGAATDPSAMLDRVSSTRTPDLEIPRDMAVSYYDYNHDYQAGSQADRRSSITQYSSGSNNLTIPVVLTPGEAADVASRVLYQTWIERTPRKVSVPLDYIYVTPSDIIDAVRDGEPYRIRVNKARFNPTQVIDIEGVSEDTGVYNLLAGNPLADISTGSFTSQTINPIVPPILAILDTAPLRDTDLQEIGIYAAGAPAVFGGGFDGESVQASVDNSVYNQEGIVNAKSTMGTADTTLGDCPRWTVWDRVNTIDVTLYDGQLGSASEAAMVNSLANLVWTQTGEIFQFKTSLPLGGHSYRLSTFLRGRYGTEAFVGAHSSGEQVVVIDTSAGADITYNASRIDQGIYWKGVNDSAISRETTPELLTMTTRRQLPFAPYYMQGARDMSDNLTITGLRRMRWRGRPLWTPPETDTPVAMEIDIYNGLTVVRTLTSTLSGGGSGVTDASAFTAYYSAADQTADFGSPQADVSIIAYQLNAIVGRGYGGSETV